MMTNILGVPYMGIMENHINNEIDAGIVEDCIGLVTDIHNQLIPGPSLLQFGAFSQVWL